MDIPIKLVFWDTNSNLWIWYLRHLLSYFRWNFDNFDVIRFEIYMHTNTNYMRSNRNHRDITTSVLFFLFGIIMYNYTNTNYIHLNRNHRDITTTVLFFLFGIIMYNYTNTNYIQQIEIIGISRFLFFYLLFEIYVQLH